VKFGPVTPELTRVEVEIFATIVKTIGSAMAEGPRDALSVEILQLQNIPFES